LRDLLGLAVVGDHVRWVLVGDEVSGMAQWLAIAAGQWRECAEQLATRLVELGVAPDGRLRSFVKDIHLNCVPDGWLELDEVQRLIGDRLSRLAGWASARRSRAAEPKTVHVLDAVCLCLEAQVASFRTVTCASACAMSICSRASAAIAPTALLDEAMALTLEYRPPAA
jgi:hypothetical protein